MEPEQGKESKKTQIKKKLRMNFFLGKKKN